MALFKISCTSDCGTYFQPYLKSVIVEAESESYALESLEKWFKASGRSFIRSDRWYIEKMVADEFGIIEITEESDY